MPYKAVVPESVMPTYQWLGETPLDYSDMPKHLEALRAVGVPYEDKSITMAFRDVETQVNPDSDYYDDFLERYPKAQVRDFDGNPEMISELDAMIAYLQILGTLVDFSNHRDEEDYR